MTRLSPKYDAVTRISYAHSTGYAWWVYGFGPALIFLRDDLGLSRATASWYSIAMAIGALGSGLASSLLIGSIGRGQFTRLGSILVTIGISAFVLGHGLPETLFGVFMVSLGGNMIVQAVTAFLNHHQGAAAPVAFTELNAIAAGLGLLAPIAVSASVELGYGWRPVIGQVAVGMVLIELWRGRKTALFGAAHSSEDQQHADVSGPLPRKFWWSWSIMVAVVGTEFSMLLWAGDLLREQGRMSTGASAASLASVVGGMFVGRVVGSVITRRLDADVLVKLSFITALIGFSVFWFSHSAALMIIGLLITGFGMSGQWPLGISRAMQATLGRPDRGTAFVAIGAGGASGVAPFLLGFTASQTGIWAAYAIVPLLQVWALWVLFTQPVARGPIPTESAPAIP